MKKLTLAERIALAEEASRIRAVERMKRANALLTEEPLDEVKQALDSYAGWLRNEDEFRKDVKFIVGLVGALIFSGCLWYILYILNGGLL